MPLQLWIMSQFATLDAARSATAHPYPLVRGGGLFLVLVGISIVVGALRPSVRETSWRTGLLVATVITTIAAPGLARTLGKPTLKQIVALVAAVVLEVVLIPVLIRATRHRGERTLVLSVLLAVGLHLVPMAVAFGPVVAGLGFLTMVNAAVGLWGLPQARLSQLWFVDGLLKVVGGAAMLFSVELGAA